MLNAKQFDTVINLRAELKKRNLGPTAAIVNIKSTTDSVIHWGTIALGYNWLKRVHGINNTGYHWRTGACCNEYSKVV
jgi:hypothetical protein